MSESEFTKIKLFKISNHGILLRKLYEHFLPLDGFVMDLQTHLDSGLLAQVHP